MQGAPSHEALELTSDDEEDTSSLLFRNSEPLAKFCKPEPQRKHLVTRLFSQAFTKARDFLGWEEGYLTAVIFINVFCVFDTLDNISAKASEELGVNYLDLAFVRIFFNFVTSCACVYWYSSDIWAVPAHFRANLATRSMMQFFSQGANIFSIALLPFGTI